MPPTSEGHPSPPRGRGRQMGSGGVSAGVSWRLREELGDDCGGVPETAAAARCASTICGTGPRRCNWRRAWASPSWRSGSGTRRSSLTADTYSHLTAGWGSRQRRRRRLSCHGDRPVLDGPRGTAWCGVTRQPVVLAAESARGLGGRVVVTATLPGAMQRLACSAIGVLDPLHPPLRSRSLRKCYGSGGCGA